MVLAIAALLLQFQPAVLPGSAKSAAPTIASASANLRENFASPMAASTAGREDSGSAGAAGTAREGSIAPSAQNGQSFSTTHVPPIQATKADKLEAALSYSSRRSWLILAVAEHGAAAFDAYSTRQAVSRGALEDDPLMRPFAHSPAIYAATQAGPVAFDYLAHRMQRSENSFVRRMWWVPQSVSLGASLFAGVHNLHVANVQSIAARQQ